MKTTIFILLSMFPISIFSCAKKVKHTEKAGHCEVKISNSETKKRFGFSLSSFKDNNDPNFSIEKEETDETITYTKQYVQGLKIVAIYSKIKNSYTAHSDENYVIVPEPDPNYTFEELKKLYYLSFKMWE